MGDTNVAHEIHRTLSVSVSLLHTHRPSPPYISKTLRDSRDGDLIALVLKCPQAFHEVGHYFPLFSATMVTSFSLLPYYSWKFVSRKPCQGARKKNVHL